MPNIIKHTHPRRSKAAKMKVSPQMTLLALVFLALAVLPHHTADALGSEPVRVEYYMEALCPYCANLTLTKILPLFKNKLINYVQLDIIPYGNARKDPNTGAVTCQHGPIECELNKLLSCAVAFNPVKDDWFPFLACVEEAGLKGIKAEEVAQVAHKCAIHAGLVPQKLMECYAGPLGDSLQRLAAERTSSLKPPHQYVPWLVVNGIPLLDDDENIMRYICVAYRGRDRPKVCLEMLSGQQEASTEGTQQEEEEQEQEQQERYERCRPGEQQQQQEASSHKQQQQQEKVSSS